MSQINIQNQGLRGQASSVATTVGKQSASVKEVFAAYGALFASVATLFCCALPALLVLLGFGLTGVLTFFTAIPGWETAGQYTIPIFVISGGVLALGFYFAYRRQPAVEGEVCEIPEGGTESACSTATRWNRRILWFSLFLYTLGTGHGHGGNHVDERARLFSTIKLAPHKLRTWVSRGYSCQ